MKNVRFINANTLKIIAAILMVVDHVGVMFFPGVMIYRYLGRLSMPIFAFMISEGCRYTKNKTKYFLQIFILAALCQIVYAIVSPANLYFSILCTFSLSILVVYALNHLKKCMLESGVSLKKKIVAITIFILVVALVSVINHLFVVDYGFWGCMLPAFASLFDFRGINNQNVQKLDNLTIRVLTFGVGLLVRVLTLKSFSFVGYSLLSIILLLAYNGKRGKYKMKNFFYIFYPAHLVVLEGILILTT